MPIEFSAESLRPPEIVGEIENPMLETMRRLWWRAFDHVCGRVALIRLSIQDRIHGPAPPTPRNFHQSEPRPKNYAADLMRIGGKKVQSPRIHPLVRQNPVPLRSSYQQRRRIGPRTVRDYETEERRPIPNDGSNG